ncbi:Uncharacterised protein [Enterobacter hormaechei]|nr:Uncharacterised protein [Enterobacter hormaechei]VAE27072.1 Uncharacterised protein [Enterobacter hormaechei]
MQAVFKLFDINNYDGVSLKNTGIEANDDASFLLFCTQGGRTRHCHNLAVLSDIKLSDIIKAVIYFCEHGNNINTVFWESGLFQF